MCLLCIIIHLYYFVNVVTVRPRFVELRIFSNGTAGGTVLFSCNASGFPSPSIVWRKNGVRLLPNSKISISVSVVALPEVERISVRTSTLQISDLVLGDKANYSCFAENNLARPQQQESSREPFEVLCKIIHLSPLSKVMIKF